MGAFLLGALGGLVGGLVAAIVLGGLIVVVLAGAPLADQGCETPKATSPRSDV